MAEASGDHSPRAAELVQALSGPLAALQEGQEGGSRGARLQALARVREVALEAPWPPSLLQEVFETRLLRPLLRCLVSDPAERCRELALELTRQGLSRGGQPSKALPFLMPALAQRLSSWPEGHGEPCEELRLGLLQLLAQLLRGCEGQALAPYLPEILGVLRGALLDPNPQAKRQASDAAVLAAKALPEHFHLQSESLITPLMQAISHQHYRVRVAVIQATGAVIQFGNVKSLDDVLSHLAQRCFDDIPQVREAVISVIGEWLLHLRDRYSYFHKLIPLLLSGLTDEMHENKELTLTYWKKIGLQWEKENEEDIKDKLDFYSVPPYYPPGLTRPELGCRELVTRHLFKILPGLCNDLTDWVDGTRIKASQLLVILLQHVEDHITQHMDSLLRALYRVCSDEESIVVRNCLKAAELIGAFVSPAVSLKLIVSDLEKTPMTSYLMVLAAVIRGSPKKILQPHLVYVANMLSQPEVTQRSEEVFYVTQLFSCVEALIEVCQEDCKEISLQLTKILITILAIPPNIGHLHVKLEEAMNTLAEVQHLEGTVNLYRQHIAQLMEWVSLTHDRWTCYSPELLQLDVIATHSGPVIGEALQDFIPILQTGLQTSIDPRVRLKLFMTLSQLLQKPNETVNSQGQFCNYLEIVIKDILAPNLQWQAGRTAAAIRTTAVSCLWALIYSELLSPEEMTRVGGELMPKIIATLGEDSKMTRLLSCRIIGTFLDSCGKQFELAKIYPEILNRLEDTSHDVRLTAAKALTSWFKCINDDEKKALLKNNIRLVYEVLLVHLDDPDQNIQAAILDTLKEGGTLYPDILAKEIEAVVYKHRTPTYCDQLLLHIESTGWRYSES
ncbi:dynein axonemal assembly factor 5 [Sceloporus undulatus]|uniref:dynein axonemal assembly factor 5 n=1 Tax=Sceloporus undulatus TaxID=8520 RepID=UPI001C4CFB27|nr:dynein axonemal assembly factor 5 [Sceloporus undulatus]